MTASLRISYPTISVIIPTLNRKNLLKRALQSVLAQSIRMEEILVVDNGSTDGTSEMISKFFPQVKFIFERKRGVSSARNKGIQASKGDWIAFLDSDDVWLPNKLERQLESQIEGSNALRLIHTNEIWMKNNSKVSQLKKHKKKGGDLFQECLSLCCISPSSVLIRRDLFEEIGYFDENLPACEDYDLWLRICAVEPVLFVDQELIIKYGGHKDQLSKSHWAMDRFRVYALEKLLNNPMISKERKEAVYNMIIEKSNILIKGGYRRRNLMLVEFYENKLKCFKKNGLENFLPKKDIKFYG